MLRVERLTKIFDNSTDQIAGGIRDASFDARCRHVLHAARPVRLRQDHDAALHRRARNARRGRHLGRRPRCCSMPPTRINVPVEQRAVGMVFQSYAIWPHMTVAENVCVPASPSRKNRRYSRAEIAEAVKRALADRRSRRLPAAARDAALRRPAAARGAGARDRARAAAAAARRAAVESRRPAARRDARRAQAAAEQDRHHHRLRHARPVRGAGAVGPDRGDRQGPHHADRLAARHLFPPGQSVRRPLRRRDQSAAPAA